MPFTPFHMGPALVAKAVMGRHFSVPVYAFTQVAIDSEVLAGFLFRGDLSYHKVMHTLAGGTAAAILALAMLRPVSDPAARLWNRFTSSKPGAVWHMESRISPTAAVLSAFVGAWGHVLLDAPTHSHMEPLIPLARGNPLDGLVSNKQAMFWCVGLAAIGGGLILGRSMAAQSGPASNRRASGAARCGSQARYRGRPARR